MWDKREGSGCSERKEWSWEGRGGGERGDTVLALWEQTLERTTVDKVSAKVLGSPCVADMIRL